MKIKSLDKTNRLTNYMEELTDELLPKILGEYKGRKFNPEMILDIKGLALNRLWPMYTTTERGRSFLRQDVQRDSIDKDVVRELRAAVEIVSTHPTR